MRNHVSRTLALVAMVVALSGCGEEIEDGPTGPVPSITSLSVNVGPAPGGTAVTISGTNFVDGATVTFGGISATSVVVVSPTQITCATPAHAAGVAVVTVLNPGGHSCNSPIGFTYEAAPTITSISPVKGASAGDTYVTITGSDFKSGASVTFGGTAATSIVVVNTTTITCDTPAHAVGDVSVTVANPDSQSDTLVSGFEFLETWTILVYGHADHNLSYSLIRDIQEMNNAVIGDHIRVLVFADYCSGRTNPLTSLPYPSGTEWLGINGNGTPETLIATDVEMNFDDPAILRACVDAVFTALPADRYGLVLWNHGGSWDGGYGHDQQDTPSNFGDDGAGMSIAQVASAVSLGLSDAGLVGTRPLEFFGFDTCLMAGNEVVYEMRNLAKTYLACAEIDFGQGWDYTATLSYISANPDATANTIATEEVAHWDAHHASASQSDSYVRAHAALDLSQCDAYATSWETLSSTMLASSGLDWLEVARQQYLSRQ